MTVTRRGALLTAGAGALAAGLATAAAPAAVAAAPPPDSFPYRLTALPIRDPYVVADAATGLYHLYAANRATLSGTAGVGVMVYRSRNLKRWSAPVPVFQPAPDLWARNGGWAPEVHRWRGRWYLFVTLHDPDKPLAVPKPNRYGIPVPIPQFQRGTIIAVSDSLTGPFLPLDPTGPVAPSTFMTLDGTLFKDDRGRPWMVYAHEWIQKLDGTIEAVRLKDDLSGAAGAPVHLFKGSDASWISEEMPTPSVNQLPPYVTDGPQLRRLPGGALGMLWSTFGKTTTSTNGTVTGPYMQTWAISPSGRLKGPWRQGRPLVRSGGHGMIFETFGAKGKRGRTLLIVHRGGTTTHARIYEIEARRDGFRLGTHRTDLDGSG